MEVSAIPSPEIAPAPAPIMQTPSQATQIEDYGAIDSFTKPKMNVKDIIISLLLITVSIYGIVYYRKGLKNMEIMPTAQEFDDYADKVDEHDVNLKKAMGSNYKKI